jgi:peptidyl serine alpha-galactosyltransferase
MMKLVLKWSEFAPLVHQQYPYLLAEMFAFCIAAAHLNLKHQIIDSLMISDTDANGEGWPLIDKIPNEEICDFARHPDHEKYALPSVVHMCQQYSVGSDWLFGKRQFPINFFSCEEPLLEEPPDKLGITDDFPKPPKAPERLPLTPETVHREVFMVCFLTRHVNDAAIFFKKQACSGFGNYVKRGKLGKVP